MDKCKNCSEIPSNFFNCPYKEIVKNNYSKCPNYFKKFMMSHSSNKMTFKFINLGENKINNKLKEIKSNDRLIITYNYLLALLKDVQEDALLAGGDENNLTINLEHEIDHIIKDGDIQIIR